MHPESLPRLKAPRDDGAVLAYPSLADAGALLAANVQRFTASTVEFAGRPLRDLRALARREAIALARTYLHQAGQPVPDFAGDSMLLSGHQPELFHPGVWLKNFALQGLARRHQCVPLNLMVDNDNAKSTVLRVPCDDHQVKVPFDSWHSEVPFEERTVQDEELFAALPARVRPLLRDWPFRPLLDEFWAAALVQRKRTPLLGERFAAGRRLVERAWGLQPLEVPLSWLCETEAFTWFAQHVLCDLPRFHAAYNDALRSYRRRHGLRSQLHPLPDLAREGAWLEAPFWVWRHGEPRRQRLWAICHDDTLELRAGTTAWPSLRGNVAMQAAQWRQRAAAGCKIRTRALTTTLFARLLLGDLFIHGIGGGKYDEVTDDLFRQYYSVEPPRYLILTATLLLPLQRFPDAAVEHERLRRWQRDLYWNPQRHLEGAPAGAAALIQEKQAWIERACATHHERAERFAHLRRINEQLQAFVNIEQEDLRQACADAERRRRLHEVRSTREFAFCLYPEEMLHSFYQPYFAAPALSSFHDPFVN